MKRIHKSFVFLLSVTSMLSIAMAQTSVPEMRLSTAAIGPLNISPGGNPPAQTIQIYNVGGGSLTPTVSSSASWLQASIGTAVACVTPLTGTCLPINITYNTAALATGTYTGFLSVSDPNAIDSPQTISVTVSVVAFGAPSGIQLYAAPDGGTATATINTHAVAVTQPSTASGGNWLAVSLTGNGSYGFYYPYQVKVTTQSGQVPGTYTGSVKISGSNTASDNTTIPVTLNVTTAPIAQLSSSSVSLFAGLGGQASQTINVANGGQGALTLTGATPAVTSGSGWLTASVSASSVTITANAASLQPGGYQGSVTLATNAANNAALVIPVNLFVTAQVGPQIGFGGIVDNTGQAPIAPGDIAVAYGTQFVTGSPAPATALPLPTNLGNVQVLVNGVAAPLYFTSAGQIDFQVPYATPAGTATVQVVGNGTPGNKVSVQVAARAPKILLEGGFGSFPIIVDYTTGAQLQSNVTAHPGDTLVIYAIGLGQTSPAATDGAAATGSPLLEVSGPVTLALAGTSPFSQSVSVTPSFVGLAPGFAGLYQVNAQIPASYVAPAGGLVSLTLTVNGTASLPVQIAVQ